MQTEPRFLSFEANRKSFVGQVKSKFAHQSRRKMLLAWELVCYQLEVQDVISLVSTCRELRKLEGKVSLWAALLKRDFPEHYPLCKNSLWKIWYKDLHKRGAYYQLYKAINLYPNPPLFSAVSCGFRVSTYRRRNCTRVGTHTSTSPRLPGVKLVRLKVDEGKKRQFVFERSKTPDDTSLAILKPFDSEY